MHPFSVSRLFAGLCIVLISASSLFGQSAEAFRQAAEDALSAFDVPGFAVGIIKDGEVVLSEGFGTRTKDKVEAVDGNSLFAIASNTKAFIATAITKLHLEGKLDLDAPVRQYLPHFAMYDDYVSNHMIVRDLLCHRAGLGTFSGDVIWYKSSYSAAEVVQHIQYVPQAYEWRAGYGYSNLMFITAGEVIKAVSGKSWDQYVKDNFLSPLGMSRTQTSVSPLADMNNVATPHITRHDNMPIPYANWDNMGAAGGIVSSTNDMLLWLGSQLAGGQWAGQEIFPAATTNFTWKPHNALGNHQSFSSAGLGWFLRNTDGHTIISHGGGYDGMYSRVALVPDQNLGVVVLSNSMTGLSSALGNYIIDTYLNRDTENWLTKAVERQKNSQTKWDQRHQERLDARVENTIPSQALNAYTGTYYDPMFGTINITEEEGKLHLNFATAPHLNATLAHWHYDTWQIQWDEAHAWFEFGTIQFVMDNNRQVSSLSFDVPNDDIFFHEIKATKK